MRYLMPTLFLVGCAFYAGVEVARVAADRRERERFEREQLNHALGYLRRQVEDVARQCDALAELAHGHEGMAPAADAAQTAAT